MPTQKFERWICERCGWTTDAPLSEKQPGNGPENYVQPPGWTYADLSPVFEGPLCPKCIASLKSWAAAR
jgi:hypothetical protein